MHLEGHNTGNGKPHHGNAVILPVILRVLLPWCYYCPARYTQPPTQPPTVQNTTTGGVNPRLLINYFRRKFPQNDGKSPPKRHKTAIFRLRRWWVNSPPKFVLRCPPTHPPTHKPTTHPPTDHPPTCGRGRRDHPPTGIAALRKIGQTTHPPVSPEYFEYFELEN